MCQVDLTGGFPLPLASWFRGRHSSDAHIGKHHFVSSLLPMPLSSLFYIIQHGCLALQGKQQVDRLAFSTLALRRLYG